jgi:hypothetical protein
MLAVPLLYLLFGALYALLHERRRRDALDAAICVLFWPMHVIAAAPPSPRAVRSPLDRLDAAIARLSDRGEDVALLGRMLDARAWAELALAKGTQEAEIERTIAPLLHAFAERWA